MNEIIILGIPVAIAITIFVVWSIKTTDLKEEREKFEEETHELAREYDRLMQPLHEQLLPLKADMDRLRARLEGRHAVVKIDDWPEQYAFGIEKCCGFEIDWK